MSKIAVILSILILLPVFYISGTYILYYVAQRSLYNGIIAEIHSEWLAFGTIGGIEYSGAPREYADGRVLGQKIGYPNNNGAHIRHLIENYTPLSERGFYVVVKSSDIRSLIQDPDGKKFYKYPIAVCNGSFCPFDSSLFEPLENAKAGREALEFTCIGEYEQATRLTIEFHLIFAKCSDENGDTKRFSISGSVAAFNPILDALRFLPGRSYTNPRTNRPNNIFFRKTIFSFEFDEYLISYGSLPNGNNQPE